MNWSENGHLGKWYIRRQLTPSGKGFAFWWKRKQLEEQGCVFRFLFLFLFLLVWVPPAQVPTCCLGCCPMRTLCLQFMVVLKYIHKLFDTFPFKRHSLIPSPWMWAILTDSLLMNMKEDFNYLHFDLSLCFIIDYILPSSFSLNSTKSLWAKHPLVGTENTLSSNKGCPESARPHVIDLTFTAHQHLPTNLVPHFPCINQGEFSALWRQVFEALVHYLPSVGFTEVNSFLVSPLLISLPLNFVNGEWLNLIYFRTPRSRCCCTPAPWL